MHCRCGKFGGRATLIGTATRGVDAGFPGWIEVQIPTVDGAVMVVDKVPVLTEADAIDQATTFPVEISVECRVIGHLPDEHNRDVVIVTLSHGVTDTNDNAILHVFAHQVIGDWR